MFMPANFTEGELTCNCGCGSFVHHEPSLRKLETARLAAGFPFHINSATRCEDWNRKVGGAKNSFHLLGRAFDIAWPDDHQQRLRLIEVVSRFGFHGFIHYDSFLHVDTRPGFYVSKQ